MSEQISASRSGAILLAAGAARRFGSQKLLAGRHPPLVSRTLAQARQAGLPVIAVIAPDGARVAAVLDVPTILAADAGLGLAHSLKAGLAAAPADWDSALILLGDMPFVTPATLARIADVATRDRVVVPHHGGRRGNPLAWGRALWPRLMALEGDLGGAVLLDALGPALLRLEVDDPGIHADIDTPDDLARLNPAG